MHKVEVLVLPLTASIKTKAYPKLPTLQSGLTYKTRVTRKSQHKSSHALHLKMKPRAGVAFCIEIA